MVMKRLLALIVCLLAVWLLPGHDVSGQAASVQSTFGHDADGLSVVGQSASGHDVNGHSVAGQSASEQALKQSKLSLNGYVKYMNTAMFDEFDSYWTVDNLMHNRLNLKWYMGESLTFSAGMRNRLIYGDFVKMVPGYADIVSRDEGFLHFLTSTVADNMSMALVTTFDRMNIEYHTGKFDITLGRQRINWGQSFVWNPNDIFNSYSFFDFDYEERPGSDAVRLRFYPDYTSTLEAAVKIDRNNRLTAAMLYRFNKWGYDIQLLGGVADTTDWIAGAGWSGSIGRTGFTGEVSYFHPRQNAADTSGVVLATAGINKIFKNSLSFSAEVIYNGYFSRIGLGSFTDLWFKPLSVKTISFSKFSWFAQVSYPIHPLLTGSLAAMYFPSLGDGYFIMPSLAFSVSNNMEASLLAQRFQGDFGTGREKLNMFFLRFRYSF